MKRIMKGIVLLGLLLNGAFAHSQTITTIAGTGSAGHTGDGGAATSARINAPIGCAFDKYGNIYFSEYNAHSIRKVNTSGVISTIAGTGTMGYNGDGIPATTARLRFPTMVIVDTAGDLFFTDGNNCRIRKVDMSTGLISTVAGNGTPGFSGDGGPATAAMLRYPGGICFDSHGNLYISDANNHRLRVVNRVGIISTYAGNGSAGTAGDGGSATAAQITPGALCVDTNDNVYIADYSTGQNRIAKVDRATGIINTIAGTDTGGVYNGDGIPATTANITPNGLVFDNSGNLFVADGHNDRIRMISPSGYIYTVAGSGIGGYGGDGAPATSAQMNLPCGVAFDDCGNLYIAEVENHRVRKVIFSPFTTPTVSLTGVITATVGSPVTVSAAVSGAGSSYGIRWLNRGLEFATTTAPTVMYTKAAGTDTITARVVPVVSYCYDSATSAAHIVNTSTAGIWGGSGIATSIYPNPAGNTLTISASGLSGISITNLLGQVVLAVACGIDEVHVDIAGLSAGMYVVRVTDANGAVAVRRVVKE